MTELDLLAAVLSDEHAAIYAYGVLGARLDEPTRAVALADFDAHRVRRATETSYAGSTRSRWPCASRSRWPSGGGTWWPERRTLRCAGSGSAA